MSSEDFKSLIVTNPDLLDEGIDVSNLRTQTNTNPRLLGAIEEYPGISYDPTAYSYLSDLNRLYASGLPETDTSQPTTPAPPSGGGGGGGGTSPGTGGGGGTTPTQPDSIGGFNPGVIPGPSGFIGLDPDMDIDIKDYDDSQNYEPKTYQGTPGGNTGSGYFDLIDNSGKDFGPYSSSMPSNLGDTGGSMDNMSGALQTNFGTPVDVEQGFTQDYSVTGALGVDPREKMNFITEQDAADPGFLEKIGLEGFDPAEAFVKAAINLAVGKPVSFLVDVLKNTLPPQDPRQTALNELYDVKDGTIQSGLMTGYNPVSGGFPGISEPTYGLQEAYDDRIDTIENTLANKYKMTAADIADVKAGNYKGDVDTVLFQRLMDLEEAKEKEKGRLDIFSGDVDPSGEGTGDASIAEKIAEADRLGISGDIGVEGEDTDRFGGGADMSFDADTFDDDVTLTNTPPTGTITPLEDDFESLVEPIEPPMTLADDKLNKMTDDVDLNDFDTTPPEPPSPPTDQDIIDRGGGDDISTGGLDPNRGQQVDRGSSGAGDNQPVSTTTGPPSTGFQPQSTYDSELEDDRDVGGGGNDGGGNGGGKIVCTMMNESYGFGSFRNKIWLKHSKGLAPEYQRGYHKIFLPLVKLSKTNKLLKKMLEHIAVHRTIDIRQESRGKVHLLGRVYRKILEPICYLVGKYAK